MKKILFFALSTLLFVSCSKSDDPFEGQAVPNANYSNGILFVNEGNFGTPNSSIGFSSFDYQNIKSDIYNRDSLTLGDVAQSMGFKDDKAFIVVNNSDKIEVVHRYSFQPQATITEGVNKPRYTAFTNNKLYVTNSGSKSVTVYSLKDYSLLKEIKLNTAVEYIVAQNNKLYVQQAAFGSGNSIAVIDGNTDNLIKTFKCQDNLQGLVAHAGFVYAISSIDNRSNFYKINTETDTFVRELTSTKVRGAKNLRVSDNKLYYTAKNDIHVWEPLASIIDYTPLFSVKGELTYSSMYGFDVINNQFLISNAEDFISPSTVQVYDMKGTKITTFKTGISTNHFYKN